LTNRWGSLSPRKRPEIRRTLPMCLISIRPCRRSRVPGTRFRLLNSGGK